MTKDRKEVAGCEYDDGGGGDEEETRPRRVRHDPASMTRLEDEAENEAEKELLESREGRPSPVSFWRAYTTSCEVFWSETSMSSTLEKSPPRGDDAMNIPRELFGEERDSGGTENGGGFVGNEWRAM